MILKPILNNEPIPHSLVRELEKNVLKKATAIVRDQSYARFKPRVGSANDTARELRSELKHLGHMLQRLWRIQSYADRSEYNSFVAMYTDVGDKYDNGTCKDDLAPSGRVG